MDQDILAQLTAIKQVWMELPELIGKDDYHNVEAVMLDSKEELENTTDEERQSELALKLMGVIWEYPEASNRFREIKTNTDICNKVSTGLGRILPFFGFDRSISNTLGEITSNPLTRTITIHLGGQGRTKSIKVSNLDFDFGEFGQLAVAIILAAQDAVEKPNPIIVMTSIILIAASIYSASTTDISEQDAAVFWGFIKAIEGGKKYASSEVIGKFTNLEREKLFHPNLSLDEVKASLLKLKQINSVNQMGLKGNYWQITEKFYIQRK